MSKILTFKDGSTFTATNSSTIYNLHAVLSDFSEVDTEAEKFTADNMTTCIFDGDTFTDIIPEAVSASRDSTNVIMTVTCRGISQDEIIARQAEQIAELQEAVAELG